MHSQEPRASKSCSIRALIRAPKRCSIRVPDSGPEKSYTIRAPKEWLVDTNVQIETVASKEPLEKHPQPRAPGPEKLFDSGPDSGPEKLFHSGPGFGPRKGPRFRPRKVVYHSGPGFGPRKDVPFGPRVQALNCFQAGKNIRVGSEDLFKIWAGFRPRSCHRGSKGQRRNGSAPEPTCGPAVGREVADSNPACPHLLRRVTLGGLQQFNCRRELWRLWQAWLAL